MMSTNTNGKSSTDASNGAYGAVHTEARTLTGWGRTAPAKSQVLSTPDLDEIVNAVKAVADQNSDKPDHLRRGVTVSYTHLTLPTKA